MKPYTERRGVVIRRWQLRRTLQHVYFFADLERRHHRAAFLGCSPPPWPEAVAAFPLAAGEKGS